MKKILVIDDSDVNLYLIQTIFEDNDAIEVLIESRSTNAIKIIKEQMPDILVLDLMMPNIDGYELLHEIKSNPALTNIPILVISAYLDDESIEKIEKYEVSEFLPKPINVEQAEQKIQAILDLND